LRKGDLCEDRKDNAGDGKSVCLRVELSALPAHRRHCEGQHSRDDIVADDLEGSEPGCLDAKVGKETPKIDVIARTVKIATAEKS